MSPLHSLAGLERRRRIRQSRGFLPGPLQQLLATPFPPTAQAAQDTRFVAVDFETTGLIADTDRILSVGYVPIERSRIQLTQAVYTTIRHQDLPLTGNAEVHGLTREMLDRGTPLGPVLHDLFDTLAGSIMVAHHAGIELSFLRHYCMITWGLNLELPVADTELIERSMVGADTRRHDFTLPAVRRHYGLPPHRAHHAVSDAVAAAEVMLCQWHALSGDRPTLLKRVVI